MEIEKALHYLKVTADQYAKAKSEAEYLKEFRKSQKALLMIEAEQQGVKTVSERECYAYSHEEYLQLLDGLKEAIHQSERLRIMVKTAEMQIDVWKTDQMRNMSEMKLR